MIKKLKAKLGSNTHFREIVNGSALAFAANIIVAGLTLVSSLIIARYYGADIVGIVEMINAVIAIFAIFGLLGSNAAILRLIPEYIEKYSMAAAYAVYKKVIVIVIAASILCGVILYLSSSLIAKDIFHKEYLGFFIALAAPFIVIRTLNTLNTDALRGLQKINLFAIMQLVPAVITLMLLIVLTYFFYNKNNPVYIIFASGVITAIVLSFVVYKTFTVEKSYDPQTVKTMTTSEFLSLSFPMFLTASMGLIISQTDTVMLGMMCTEAEVGIYAIAWKLALLTSFILTAINTMAAPKFSQLYHSGKMEDLREVAQRSSQLIFWTTLPLILLYIFGGYYILAIFGEAFRAGYYALIFLAIGQFVNAAAGSVGYFLNMTGHQKVIQNIVLFGAIINVFLNLLLIPRYGMEGAAIASMISVSLWNIMASMYIKKIFGFNISYIPLFKIKERNE